MLPFLAIAAHLSLSPTPLERRLLDEINFARTQPRAYAQTLRRYRQGFRGDIAYYPGNPRGLRTAEGTRAVDEAIGFLERQRPLAPLDFALLLATAARFHVHEQGPRGAIGHLSPDGADPRDRMTRIGGGSYVAEAITYGPPTAIEAVRQFIIDDNVPSRGHRRTLFAAEMRFAGTACGPHRTYGMMCVVEFARTTTGSYGIRTSG